MNNVYLLPNLTKVKIEGKDAFIIGNSKGEKISEEDVLYYVKFADEKGSITTDIIENAKGNYDRLVKLSDIKDVWVLPYYTKVSVNGQIGYIMENDEDNSEEDLSDLNYLIKFGEDLDDVLKDINENNIPWYDDSFLHYEVVAI